MCLEITTHIPENLYEHSVIKQEGLVYKSGKPKPTTSLEDKIKRKKTT